MAELEYLSVFLLYTEYMYVHYKGDISDWGNTETATPESSSVHPYKDHKCPFPI